MNAFALGFVARAAVMLPTIIAMAACLWLAMKKLGFLRLGRPFNEADVRTWPLSYLAADAAMFALVFAATATSMVGGDFSLTSTAGTAAIASMLPAAKSFLES